MANKFRYRADGLEPNSLFKGDWSIDISANDTGGGPSVDTDLYHGADIPDGGYVVYSPGKVCAAINDKHLLSHIEHLGGDSSNVPAALLWAATTDDVLVLTSGLDETVTDGLVLSIDPANVSSFVDGKPATNIHSPGIYGHNTSSYGNVTVVQDAPNKGPGWKMVTITNRGNNHRIMQWAYTGMSANIKYWHSIEFDWGNMRDKGYFIGFDGNGTGSRHYYHNNDFTTTGSTNITNIPNGRFHGSIIHTGSHNHAFFIQNYSTGASGINDFFYYKEPQVETTEYPTPYTSGTRLQNTALYDLSSNNHHATLVNSPVFESPGLISFDGIDNYISIPNPLAHQPNLEQEWTVTAWVNLTEKTDQRLVTGMNQGLYAVAWQGNNSILYLNGGVNDYYKYGGDLIAPDTWRMITFRFRNSDGFISIYRDLTEVRTSGPNKTSTPSGIASTLHIGAGMQGYLSGLKIYDRVLSHEELAINYYKGKIVTDGLVCALDAGNLASYTGSETTVKSLVTGTSGGVLTNGVGFNTNSGGVFEFDGVDDYINLGNPANINNPQVTVTFWYNPTVQQNSTHNGILNGQTPNGRFCLFWYGTNGVSVQYRDDSGKSAAQGGTWTRTVAPTIIPTTDTWYFIQITGDEEANEWRCGINLNNSTSSNSSQYVDPDPTNWILGRRAGTAYDNSKIANVQIYNRILSQEEIKQNFDAYRNRVGL